MGERDILDALRELADMKDPDFATYMGELDRAMTEIRELRGDLRLLLAEVRNSPEVLDPDLKARIETALEE